MPNNPAVQAQIDERRKQLIKLRRVRTPYESPQVLNLGYGSPDAARKDFYRAITARRKATEAEIADYRAEQSQIISDMLDIYLPLALGTPTEDSDDPSDADTEGGPDLKAAEMVLKLLERDAKLNGWEAALKAELSGPGGGAVPISTGTLRELRDLINTAGEPDSADEDDDETGATGPDGDADDDSADEV